MAVRAEPMTADTILADGVSLALSPGDRDLFRLLTTPDPDDARAAWSKWKLEHPLDTATARELRLLPLATARLLELGIEDCDLGRLRGITRFLWLWSQRTTRASVEAASALGEHGIDVVALKGLALHSLGLLSRAERPITDGDLMVTGELHRACEVLEGQGFKVRLRQNHAWTCVRGPQEELDLHQYPLHIDSRSRGWTLAAAKRVGGTPFKTPEPAHLIVHACFHGTRKGGGSVLWALDVMRIIDGAVVAWDELLRLARERRYALVLADALRVVAGRVPEPVLRELGALPVSALEALEYVSAAGIYQGPWMTFASRAAQAMRDLRKGAARLDDRMLAATERRLGIQWRSSWPAAWRRREPMRAWPE